MSLKTISWFLKKFSNRPYQLYIGLSHAIFLNWLMLVDKIHGKKTMIFSFVADVHFFHLEPIIKIFRDQGYFEKYGIYIITDTNAILSIRKKMLLINVNAVVLSALSVRFLLFCDFMLTLWQGQIFPYIGCKIRACSFHGQPSKGNTYSAFNYKQINTLFFYGPLMRTYYFKKKKENLNWPNISCYDVGQPISDRLFTDDQMNKSEARIKLGLKKDRFTLIYAPSFEYCSSIAIHGKEIIKHLIKLDINLIVKPHPNFYLIERFDKDRDGPIASEWRENISEYNSYSNCIFKEDGLLDTSIALTASDIMLTDYSGIAFDGILLDLGMIYWNCPLLYTDYLPKRFGIDPDVARNDLSCNVGRDAGIVVENIDELTSAVKVYQKSLNYKADLREHIREQLLFNKGHATEFMVQKILELLG